MSLEEGPWFSLGTPVSSTNKSDRHIITDILLKEVLNAIILNQTPILAMPCMPFGFPGPKNI
jgi:hypothetical protein